MWVDIFVVILFLINTLFLCNQQKKSQNNNNNINKVDICILYSTGPFKAYMPGDKPQIRPIWEEIREYLEERKKRKTQEGIELTKPSHDESDYASLDATAAAGDGGESVKVVKHEKLHYFAKNILSKKFFALLAFGLVGGYTISYGLGTIEYQFADLTDKEEFYDQMFSIVACIGIVIIPLWSFVINRFGLHVFGVCLICMEILFYIALMTRWMPAFVANFFVFSFIRVSVGAAISNYARMFFDITLFGTFTGTVWFVKKRKERKKFNAPLLLSTTTTTTAHTHTHTQ